MILGRKNDFRRFGLDNRPGESIARPFSMPLGVVMRQTVGRIAAWPKRYVLARHLEAMSDKRLDDMGITRAGIPAFVGKAFPSDKEAEIASRNGAGADLDPFDLDRSERAGLIKAKWRSAARCRPARQW